MGRRTSSFGYRLGVTHFWRFQQFIYKPIKGYNLLSKNMLHQLIYSLFSHNGYKVLFCSSVSSIGEIVIDVKLLTSYYLESINFFFKKRFLIDFNNFIFNYYFFFFNLFGKIQVLLILKIKLFIVFKLIYQLNYYFFNLLYFVLFLVTFYLINYFKFLSFISYCLKKFFIIKNIFLKKKKKFFSFYKLNLISKNIENKLRLLVFKKEVILNTSFIYSIIPYFNNFTIKKFKDNLKGFWIIKQNLKIFEIIYFSCLFSLSNLLLGFILDNLSRKKKTHIKFLNFFCYLFESLYFQDLIYISGVKISVFGKIDAKMRKQKFFFFLGKINLTRISCSVSYTQKNFETRFGVLGIRVWIKV